MKRLSLKTKTCAAVVALALVAGLTTSPARASGVPVVDLAAITQMITEYTQLLKQYDQLVSTHNMVNSSFTRAYNQFDRTMTGVTGYGVKNSTSDMLNLLPEALDETLDLIRSSGANALPGPARSLYREFALGDACDRVSAYAQASCYRRAALNAMKLYSYQEGQNTAMRRRSAIQQMLDSINSTTTAKEAADMQQRIAQEQASLQNEQIRYQLLKAKFDEEERLLKMQHQAELDRLFYKRVD